MGRNIITNILTCCKKDNIELKYIALKSAYEKVALNCKYMKDKEMKSNKKY